MVNYSSLWVRLIDACILRLHLARSFLLLTSFSSLQTFGLGGKSLRSFVIKFSKDFLVTTVAAITYIYLVIFMIAAMCGAFRPKCHEIIAISLAFKCFTIPLLLHDAVILIVVCRDLVAVA